MSLSRCGSLVFYVVLTFWCIFSMMANANSINFFAKPHMLSAVISPDGKLIANIINSKQGQELVLNFVDGRSTKTLLNLSDFAPDNAYIGRLVWLDNTNLSAQFVEIKKGVEGLVDTQAVRFLLVIQVPRDRKSQPIIKSVRTKGQLVNPLRKEDDVFLYAKSSNYSKVFKIKSSLLSPHKKRLNKLSKKDGGQFKKKNEVASIKGYAIRWFFDSDGETEAVLNYNSEDGLTINRIDDKGGFQVLKTWNTSNSKEKTSDAKRLLPFALAQGENNFYCLDYNQQEIRSVYKVNFVEGSEELVYESANYEIVRLITSESSGEFIGVKILKNGELVNNYIDAFSGDNEKEFQKNHESLLFIKISESLDGYFSIAYSESYNQPGRFILINNKSNSERTLGRVMPHITRPLETQQIEGQVSVEGLDIPYLLNLPKKSINRKFPLIVHPHGGPIGPYDTPYFDSAIQYFNAKGFAVLRINYRGSGGHTLELKQAGRRQWGNMILKDILTVSKVVAARKDIETNKVCIFGSSYGGYAATALTISNPELFQCGVNMAGVSDVNLSLNSTYASLAQDAWLKQNVGDSVTEYERNKSFSPVYQIKDLNRPLLIMHGSKDRVVDVEHAYRLKLMLEKHNKKFEWKIFEDQGHTISSTDFANELYETTVNFIQRNLLSQ